MNNIIEKKVTFFYSRLEEKQIFENIAIELKKEKIKSDFSKNLKKKQKLVFIVKVTRIQITQKFQQYFWVEWIKEE